MVVLGYTKDKPNTSYHCLAALIGQVYMEGAPKLNLGNMDPKSGNIYGSLARIKFDKGLFLRILSRHLYTRSSVVYTVY